MTTSDIAAGQFEARRSRLLAVAHRILGDRADAEDAVQEAWLRVARTGLGGVQDVDAWLHTVVARICLDHLRARAKRATPVAELPETTGAADPADLAEADEAVGRALSVVLASLNPAERLAFVLHDLFAVPFAEVAEVVGGTPAASRQLASRARRRMQAQGVPEADPDRHEVAVRAFFAAAREGDFDALLQVLDPDVVLRADATAVRLGSAPVVRGAGDVARIFAVRSRDARAAIIDGLAGAVWAPAGPPRVVFEFVVRADRVVQVELVADLEVIAGLDLTLV